MTAEEYFNRGVELHKQGYFEHAIENFTKAIRLAPESAKAFYNRGNTKASLGLHIAAIADYDEAIRLDPENAAVFGNRGSAKSSLGRHADAIADFDEAIQLDPELATAFSNRGSVKSSLGRHADAIEDFDEAIRLDPELAPAFYSRGSAEASLHRPIAAIADYDEAIRLAPESAKAFYNRGSAKASLRRHAAAIEDFNEAIHLAPDDANVFNNRGSAKYSLGRYAEAIADYDEAIRLAPESATAFNNRGSVKASLRRHAAAIEDFNEAIRLAPDDAIPWEGKAIVYFSENNTAWGKACLNQAIYLRLQNLRNVFVIFGRHPTAPFLTMRLIQERVPPDQYGKIGNLIHTTFQQSSPLYSFIAHELLQRNKNYTEESWKKWLGVINFYMGDPITAFQILGALAEAGSQDMMVHYYLIQSCYDFAEDPDPYIAKAIEVAERVKWQAQQGRGQQSVQFSEEQILNYYYAGLIFYLDEEPDDTLECLSKIEKQFLPAAYFSLLIWNEKEEKEQVNRLKKEIIKREKKAGEKGFARGLEVHYIDFENDRLHKPFAHYCRYFEIAGAIGIFANIADVSGYHVEQPYDQQPFYELFKIHPDDLEGVRMRQDFAPLLEEWEQRLQEQKEEGIPATDPKGRTMKAAVREIQEADDKELAIGEYIEEFSLKPAQYKELLEYFYLKNQLSGYQRLLLYFYICDQVVKRQLPPKSWQGGMKDLVKKVTGESLSVLTGIVVGGGAVSLSVPAALAVSLGIAFAKGAMGELFNGFYKEAHGERPFAFEEFKAGFEGYIAGKREELGENGFEKRYPIGGDW